MTLDQINAEIEVINGQIQSIHYAEGKTWYEESKRLPSLMARLAELKKLKAKFDD